MNKHTEKVASHLVGHGIELCVAVAAGAGSPIFFRKAFVVEEASAVQLIHWGGLGLVRLAVHHSATFSATEAPVHAHIFGYRLQHSTNWVIVVAQSFSMWDCRCPVEWSLLVPLTASRCA